MILPSLTSIFIMAEKHQFFSFPVLFTFSLFLFMVFRIWKKFRFNNSTPNLPPGPWKLPIIGSIHHLVGSLPHHRIGDLANKYGPLMHLQLGEVTTIVVSSSEIAKEFLKTNDLVFAQRPFLLAASAAAYNSSDIAFAPYGDYWRQMRKICTLELLTAKRVQSFRSVREDEVSKLVRSVNSKAGSPINFSRMINSLTYSIISTAAFGKIWKGEEIFIPNVKKLIKAAGGFSIADLYPSIKLLHAISPMRTILERLAREIDSIFQNIIEEHRTRKAAMRSGAESATEDLVDVLLNFQDQEDLQFPIKSRIITNARAIARDPNYWIEAERFYPERFLDCSIDYKGNDFEFIPFGAGRRICPGITFGMANVEFPLARLLYHFDWKLPNELQPEDLDMKENFGAVVTRENDLHIIPIPYLQPPVN